MHINIEVKARTTNPEKIRSILRENDADFRGVDHQIDTYFNTEKGRLKLRDGKIENSLIYYEREDKAGPKQSKVLLVNNPDKKLKELFTKLFGVMVVVSKQREIYFIDNVKFHIDQVKNLGSFIEIEAIDKDGTIGKEKLLQQCKEFMKLFGINEEDLVTVSYSDLLAE